MDPLARNARVTADTRIKPPEKQKLSSSEPVIKPEDTLGPSMLGQAADAMKGLTQKQVADMLMGTQLKPLNELWKVKLGDSEIYAPVMDDKGIVYASTGQGNSLKAVKEGKELWSLDNMAESWITTPAIGPDGTVVVGGSSGEVIAVKDGKVLWNFDAKNMVLRTPSVGPDGIVYAVTDYGLWKGKLFAVDGNGKKRWHFEFPDHSLPRSSPAAGPDGTVYVGCATGKLFAIKKGKMKWEYRVPGSSNDIQSRPVIGPDGTVYFGSHNGCIYAVKDGKKSWEFGTGEKIMGDITLGPDGTIYAGSYDHHVYAVKDGEKLWDFDTGGTIFAKPVLAPDGTLYVGSANGTLYALKEGKEVARFRAGTDINSSPVMDPQGSLYFGGKDGKLRAVGSPEASLIRRRAEIDEKGGEAPASRKVELEQDDEWLSIDGFRMAVNHRTT